MPNDGFADLRREYGKAQIEISDFPANPIEAFQQWFDIAIKAELTDANAMVLSTSNKLNRPSSRVVLLKEVNTRGLVFFSNYTSKKGRDLQENPNACLNFFWPQLERQIRVEGLVEKISESESDAYFSTRPRLSQAGAIVSAQSTEIVDRIDLEREMASLMNLSPESTLQRPENWGGYILIPDYFEFWQGRPGRLHDRICYEETKTGWRKFRLAP